MPKKTTKKVAAETVSQDIDTISISGTVGAETSKQTLKGKEISLNQKAESFFGIGDIWLTHTNYSATVPQNISPQHLSILEGALARGQVVLGNKYIPPIDRKDEVLEEYWHLIKTYGLDSTKDKCPAMVAFRKLFRVGTDRNWTAKEIANFCIERETRSKNRDKTLKLLRDTHRYSSCPDTLLESQETK
tara:strand:+ start:66614 stop:67180 length:567 start_codon:yes stop_codon:yes gene_type:complete